MDPKSFSPTSPFLLTESMLMRALRALPRTPRRFSILPSEPHDHEGSTPWSLSRSHAIIYHWSHFNQFARFFYSNLDQKLFHRPPRDDNEAAKSMVIISFFLAGSEPFAVAFRHRRCVHSHSPNLSASTTLLEAFPKQSGTATCASTIRMYILVRGLRNAREQQINVGKRDGFKHFRI